MPINGRQVDRFLLRFERAAVIVTAIIVGWQTTIIARHTEIFTDLASTAVKHYEASVLATTTDRSATWTNRIREKDTWEKLTQVNRYLRDEKDETKKIQRIETDVAFKGDLYELLALFEDLGYLYNTGKVDREFVKRSPSGALVQFYDNSRFWIEYERRKTKNSQLNKEFEQMVVDVQKPS